MSKKTGGTETTQGCLAYFALIIALIFGAVSFSNVSDFFGSQDSEQANVARYSVDAELLNCRESPNQQAPVLAQLEAGLEVDALESKGVWIEISPEQIPNGSCWVSSNFMTLVEMNEDTPPLIGNLFINFLLFILPASYFLWDRRRVSEIRRLAAEAARSAKAENRKKQQAKERKNKSEIEKLLKEINEALEKEKKECVQQYRKIVSTIEREEAVLKDLETRHPELVRLMKTRGVDDSSSKLVKDLHAAFKKLD